MNRGIYMLILLGLTTVTANARQNTPSAGYVLSQPGSRFEQDQLRRVVAVSKLKRGQAIRVRVESFPQKLEGRFQNSSLDTLTMLTDGKEKRFALTEIEALWVHGSATRQGAKVGAKIGGVVGAAGGALMGLVVSGLCQTESYDCPGPILSATVGALVGASVTAAGGAWLGSIFGASNPQWHRIFKSR